MTAVNLNALGSVQQIVQPATNAVSPRENSSLKDDFAKVMNGKVSERGASAKVNAEEGVKTANTSTRKEVNTPDKTKAKAFSKQEKKPITDKQETAPETANEMMAGAAQILNITPEELKEALDSMGLNIGDLTDRNNVAQLILMLNGSQDISDMLVDNGMLEAFNELNDFIADTLNGSGLNADEFKEALLNFTKPGENEALAEANEVKIPVEEEPKGNTASDMAAANATNEEAIEFTVTKTGEESGSGSLSGRSGRDTDHTELRMANAVEGFVRNLEMTVQQTGEVTTEQVSIRDIVYQVVQKIRVDLNLDHTSLEMRLNPENLGRVSISITNNGGVMTARIDTENAKAREAIESQLQILKENIEAKGIRVEAVEVRVSDFNMADNTETGNNQQSANGEESRGSRRNQGGIPMNTDEEIAEAERVAQEVLADTGSTVSYRA